MLTTYTYTSSLSAAHDVRAAVMVRHVCVP